MFKQTTKERIRVDWLKEPNLRVLRLERIKIKEF